AVLLGRVQTSLVHRLLTASPASGYPRALQTTLTGGAVRPVGGHQAASWRAALAIASASMPAWWSSSAGLPEVGIRRTARVLTGAGTPAEAKPLSTASPRPPSGQWSSAVTRPRVCLAAWTRVSVSIGLIEYRSITRAWIPSEASSRA